MIRYLFQGSVIGDQTHMLSRTFLGGLIALPILLNILDISFLLSPGARKPKESIYKTLWPLRANSIATCCLFVQKDYPNQQ